MSNSFRMYVNYEKFVIWLHKLVYKACKLMSILLILR